ncbi:DUF1285 domain-containing protein [Thalassotalea ponticola]|uniref:DUF1285 domain-containing protein n=1 Tax=Thalassotalea ponticola TaxID=1523392 RepID=UPI0025B3EA74|nr:DUF1285 domain-containing protein [Thalassotalea ponticola]MDN3652934.1 DUF1285 domain-containing protein [Thalassotalea ponticola]
MSIESLQKQLSANQQKLPPVEQWDPPYCGEMDMRIDREGQWHYQGSPISRQRLVKLFASVLVKEADDYFLVTPVEKVKISVDALPFVVTQWQWVDEVERGSMLLTTNLGDEILLDKSHPIKRSNDGSLRVNIRRNLEASIHRNVYYQWIEIADKVEGDQQLQLYIHSEDIDHLIGVVDLD